jgi:hypothetical protein
MNDILKEKLLESVTKIENAKNPIEEIKEEVKEEVEQEIEDNTQEELEPTENTQEESEELEKLEEEIKENIDKGIDLKKTLSGQPREFREAVELIKDPETQARVIEAGKILRAREDQVRLELGNTKKEMANFKSFDESFKKNPLQTIKDLAKFANIDLNNLIEPVQDEYDYRTPEEIARDNHYKNIESRLAQIERQKQEETANVNAREIEQFKSAKDSNGEIKYPHFERVRGNMATFYIEGHPLYNPDLTLEKAYQKAIMLDDELVELRDIEIARKITEKRKEELEKATNKRFTALSISSIHIKTIIALRRVNTPITPMLNSVKHKKI